MHSTDAKSRFIELRAHGWSLARIADHFFSQFLTTAESSHGQEMVRFSYPPAAANVNSQIPRRRLGAQPPARRRHPRARPSLLICGRDLYPCCFLLSFGVPSRGRFTTPENCTVSAPFLHQKHRFAKPDPCPSTSCKRTAGTWCNFAAWVCLTMKKSKTVKKW